jgi:hypothetical protein
VNVDAKKFDQWFTSQFGKRPSSRSADDLRIEEQDAMHTYNRLKLLREATRQWDNQFNDCLYAWIAAQQEQTNEH